MAEQFFIVGAQRCGTTYFYHMLDAHPEIEMARPLRPEPKFFLLDELYERGIEYYENRFYRAEGGAKVRGEKSVSYMESEKAAARIARHYPASKLLFVLRDPVERAASNYFFSVRHGLEKLPMEDAFLREEERRRDYDAARVSVSPYAYLRRGRYVEYLAMYGRYFPRGAMKVILYEALVASPSVLQDVYAFLDVAADFVPSRHGEVINGCDEKPEVALSPELTGYLRDYFAGLNSQLAEEYALDLSLWGGGGGDAFRVI